MKQRRVVSSKAAVGVECSHPAVFNTLCVTCGKTVGVAVEGAAAPLPVASSSSAQAHVRAGPSTQALTFSNGLQLHLSREEALRVQANKVSGLRGQRKLALVLDLDHTLLHASPCNGPPSAAELAGGIVHLPIEESVLVGAETVSMLHAMTHGPARTLPAKVTKHHLVKLRPHVHLFLKRACEIAQMTIYTAGTRKYAEAVGRAIDPFGRYFSDRIVSRSDISSSDKLTSLVTGLDKSLERIFLGDSSMAVIIDDREDVWKGEQSQQLLLVKPFHHFNGPQYSEVNNSSGQGASSRSQTISLTALGKYIDDSSARHAADSDDQLLRCLEILERIHEAYFDSSTNETLVGAAPIHSVAQILTDMKRQVLRGCVVSFSGVIPTNELHPEGHALWRLASMLGAFVTLELHPRTTHMIAINTATAKVQRCVEKGDVWVLHPDWLLFCRWGLARAQESTFMLISNAPLPCPFYDADNPPVLLHTAGSLGSLDGYSEGGGGGGGVKRKFNDDGGANPCSSNGGDGAVSLPPPAKLATSKTSSRSLDDTMAIRSKYELSLLSAGEEQQCDDDDDDDDERRSYGDEREDNSNDAFNDDDVNDGGPPSPRSTGVGTLYRSASAYSSSDESEGMFDDLESAINSR